jgi:AraC-like DNA-binding protein
VSVLDEVLSEYVWARPALPLRPYVERYSGYRLSGAQPGRHRGLPSPCLTVILTLDEPLTMAAHPDPAQPGGDYETLIGGLHTDPAIITHPGRQSGVQLALHPLGARRLLGFPAGELAHLDVPGDAVLGRWALELQNRIRTAKSWPARFAAIDTVLLRLLAGRGLPSSGWSVAPEVSRAWQLLRAGEGRVSVLAREVGWSTRHLSARMATETGLTPKAAVRVMRFGRAQRLLVSAPRIADVAAECGYFDQAHLTREFRALAGATPGAWLREEGFTEFRNVQSPDPAAAED